MIVQDQVSGVNRFDTSNNANWTIEQIKIEQILASGELSAPVQMPEVITTGKGKMLVLITSRSYAFDEGFSKIKVSWPDNTSDIFKIHFEDAEIDNRITTIDMNEEPIWPAKNDTRTNSIINK
ncbi:hypothetical protein [Arcticibacterium luteifluviistationis]|uniref:Uncharacterized protein n=1 Tax=Arcticibacterium luteifluviistationis TaxID=1784714 RepID=A0A2Z4GE99_9BACT|nr:hypothetical protein [Arcticibacterium luteifluviistationis]AWV99447.1 hypothetical protein DJ013_15265 [Arcticibacterium luteifluviistationis]